ncbi:MAG: hypothetical protein KCHDKBKB_00145 [Elusimicrobia bacterium]|nr:hypothetical protein [Elusimicrobiota bacterium]
MKVKKFRIKSRLSSVARILKIIMGVKQLPEELEESLLSESEAFLKHVVPSAFYTTWAQEDVPSVLKPSLQQAGLSKAIAVSALVATIGSGAEDYLSELLMKGETQRSLVVTALSEDAADASLHFLMRLLTDDAKNDDCDLSDPVLVSDPIFLTEILPLVEAQQEGVTVDHAQHLSPRFTRIALMAWWPMSKKKRASLASKKKLA